MSAARKHIISLRPAAASLLRRSRGVTLVELMVAVTILAIVAATTAGVYKAVMKGLVISKSRGVAARLAQDKLETLRGLSYDLLLVTPQEDLDVPPGVDLTNYPPETFNIGGKLFLRRTIVSRVYRDSAGNVIPLSPSAADTGLKQIMVNIGFALGATVEHSSYTALFSDPGLIPLNATLYGLVTGTSGVAIADAKVFITENQNWTGLSSSTGYYSIEMDTKTYTVTASKPGFLDKISSQITPLGPTQLNIILTAKSYGKVAGILTARPDRLLISGVFAGAAGAEPAPTRHFLELYNPTTYQIMITDGTSAKLQVKHVISDNSINNVPFTWSGTGPVYIASEKYFLIATDSPTINGVAPDALFTSMGPFSDLTKAGVAIRNEFGVAYDTVGWTNDGNPGPAAGLETAGVVTQSSNWGSGGLLRRKSTPSAVTSAGNSYDSYSNVNDVLLFSSVASGLPRNSASAASPVQYGAPASSANVLATDGYSSAAFASSTGYYLLNSVTTGTWSLAGYLTTFSSVTADNVQVNTGLTTALDLLLEPAAQGQGGVSGSVKRSDNLQTVSGISVAAGLTSTLANASGDYVLSLASGTYTVSANSGFSDSRFNAPTSTINVTAGQMLSGINFNLVPSGMATGKVTTNGIDAYPDIPVHALSQGLEAATAVTDSGGNYSLSGIPAGTATIEPVLDTQAQTATPATLNVTISEGTTLAGNNFQVGTSLGTLSGTVRQGTALITAGVLVIASTSTFASVPTIDSAYRAGSNVIYSGISDSAGQYTFTVARGSTYTIYGYFTAPSRSDSTVTTAVSVSNICVSSAQTVNLTW